MTPDRLQQFKDLNHSAPLLHPYCTILFAPIWGWRAAHRAPSGATGISPRLGCCGS
jgi:hypothetical protein